MTAYDLMMRFHEVCRFQTKEGAKVGTASNKEVRRWLNNKAIEINGQKFQANDEVPNDITSIVMFPKSKFKCTLF